ncbi:class I SAM-dependent methyltransferase [Candidatus Woesearchaeota archaeon]|nr:class I SAM-dependent methyltransferase [Candidatus Woesearchaeota archaeon]
MSYTLKQVQQAYSCYGNLPLFYINLSSRLSFFGKGLRKRAIDKLNLKKGDNVLEIACGAGLNFRHIEELIGKRGEITAVDCTKEMLDKAKQQLQKQGYHNIRLIEADAANIKLKGKFDAVISTLGFSSIPDHKKTLINCMGSLKKGKKLVMLEGKLFTFRPLNLFMPVIRWSRSWDRSKDLIGDARGLFPNKNIRIEEYNLGSDFILELEK